MPKTKVTIPGVAEAGPCFWSKGTRAGDFLFVSLGTPETRVEIEAVAHAGKPIP